MAGTTVDKRSYELGRHWAAIECAERGVPDFVEIRRPLERAVELSPAHANTGLARSASQRLQQPEFRRGRIGESHPRSKVVISSRSQRAGNTGITGKHPSSGRAWKPG